MKFISLGESRYERNRNGPTMRSPEILYMEPPLGGEPLTSKATPLGALSSGSKSEEDCSSGSLFPPTHTLLEEVEGGKPLQLQIMFPHLLGIYKALSRQEKMTWRLPASSLNVQKIAAYSLPTLPLFSLQ